MEVGCLVICVYGLEAALDQLRWIVNGVGRFQKVRGMGLVVGSINTKFNNTRIASMAACIFRLRLFFR